MNAWITLLLLVAFLVASILVNLYLTSCAIDRYHKESYEPLDGRMLVFEGKLRDLEVN